MREAEGETPSAPWGRRVPLRPADRVQSIAKSQRAPLPREEGPVGPVEMQGPRGAHTALTEEKRHADPLCVSLRLGSRTRTGLGVKTLERIKRSVKLGGRESPHILWTWLLVP